ncbi:hypothetical protein C8Q73DRAFT_794214 [Cubamyces lactineus]|nr:hypothetical protein C8Q73DRAFT_794214 [Cubamyces lactineus]
MPNFKPRQQDVHLPDITHFFPGGQPLVIYDPHNPPYGAIPADGMIGDPYYGHGFPAVAPLYPQMPPGEIEIAPFFQPPTIPDHPDVAHALEDYSLPIVCDDVSELLKAVMGDVEGMGEDESMEKVEDESEEKDEAMVEFLLTHMDSEADEEEVDMDTQPVQDESEAPADA